MPARSRQKEVSRGPIEQGSTKARLIILEGQADTVFLLRKGATLRNAIIGKNQGEGVYCIGGGCTIENVWFEDVCEDAISMYSPLPKLQLYPVMSTEQC